MGKAYSQDLRDRGIEAVETEGMPCGAAACSFGIGESSAIQGGLSVTARRGAGRLSARFLKERGVKVTTEMLSYFYIGEGISFKKKPCTPATRSAGSSSMRAGSRRT